MVRIISKSSCGCQGEKEKNFKIFCVPQNWREGDLTGRGEIWYTTGIMKTRKEKKMLLVDHTASENIKIFVEALTHLARHVCLLDTMPKKMPTKERQKRTRAMMTKVADAFGDAVVGIAVSTILHMPEHWKREWLENVCILKDMKETETGMAGKKKGTPKARRK